MAETIVRVEGQLGPFMQSVYYDAARMPLCQIAYVLCDSTFHKNLESTDTHQTKKFMSIYVIVYTYTIYMLAFPFSLAFSFSLDLAFPFSLYFK